MWLNLGSAVSAEIASLAGYDWLLVDLEHGSGDYRDLAHQLWAAQAGPAQVVVRVGGLDSVEIKRVLDLGPAGVMIPNVETPEQAAAAVAAVRIPPLGARGAATSTRASGYGFTYNRYLSGSNREVLLTVQIESAQAVENAGAIAATAGIDVLFIGPLDLSVSLGVGATAEDALRFSAALQTVVASAAAHGKPAGILARNAEQAQQYLRMGFTFIAMGSDRGMLASGMRHGMEALRRLAAGD